MSLTDDERPAGSGESSAQDPARTLDEITRRLRRMLVLAELSVSDLDVDRQLLQKTLERLRDEVDRLADTL